MYRKGRTGFYKRAINLLDGMDVSSDDVKKTLMCVLEDYNDMFGVLENIKGEWEATFDAIESLILIHNEEFEVVRLNRSCQRKAGIEFREILDKPYFDVFPWMKPLVKECRDSCLKNRPGATEISDGKSIYSARFYPVKGKAEGRYIHILDDITQLKGTEKRLKEEIEVTTALLNISEATTKLGDINMFLEGVLKNMSKIFNTRICLAYMWDEFSGEFVPTAYYGLHTSMVPFFRITNLRESNIPLIKKVFHEGKPRVFSGRDAFPIGFLEIKDIKKVIVLPIMTNKEYMGLIMCIFTEDVHITRRHMAILNGIHNQICVTLEEARLYRESIEKAIELSNRIEIQTLIHEIDRTILSTLSHGDILETVSRMMEHVLNADSISICLVEKERNGFVFVAGTGEYLPRDTVIGFRDTSLTEVYLKGRVQYVANLKNTEGLHPLEARLLGEGFSSVLRVPLVVKGEVIGILNAISRRPSAFSYHDLNILETLADQISVAIENARLFKDLEELFIGTVSALSGAIDAKSPWTAGHSERVTRCAMKIGRALDMDEEDLKTLRLASLLHDIGKIGVAEGVLEKPARLTEEEIGLIKTHPVKSRDILSPIKQLKEILDVVLHHHEYYDGSGYPDSLRGEDIPIMARIISVADTVDAMASDRPYRKGKTMEAIVEELKRCTGTQFDPHVVAAFLKVKDEVASLYTSPLTG